jgi:Tfp pilus assembly protein PilF
MAMEEWDDAIASYDAIIMQWPNSEEAVAAAQNNKGVCLIAKGEVEQAAKLFAKLSEIPTVRRQALQNLTRCHAHKRDEPNAKLTLQKLTIEFGEGDELVALRREIENLFTNQATDT